MALSSRACVSRVTSRGIRPLLAAAGLLALAGCGPDGQPNLTAAQPRGASVAFDQIDGLPPAQFHKLVDNLNEEAQTRRLAVTARDSQAAYRVRGYLAAKVTKSQTTVSWTWDVFDGDQQRALRITGEESVKDRHRDAWAVADDAMLHRIARSSMEQLATFLTSPEVAPGTPRAAAPAPAKIVLIGDRDPTPEAAGIFRIFKPQADPAPETDGSGAEAPAARAAAKTAARTAARTAAVPLPRPRPNAAPAGPAMSDRASVTLAAASH
jgi:hypothetical protein